MSLPTLCSWCRLPMPNGLDRSICLKCMPPDESEIVATSKLAASRREVEELQRACEEHIAERNELAQRNAELMLFVRELSQASVGDSLWAFVEKAKELCK